jgi:small subunit ribosomal protein S6
LELRNCRYGFSPAAEAGVKDFSGKGNRMSRVYEVMFIVRPDAAEEDIDKLIAGFSENVTKGGGVVKTVEKMGRRKLAYLVRKFNDGNYVLLTIEATGAVVLELERRLRVTEQVIKFITVRIDEEEKRLAKVKALRGVRRSSTVPAQAPAAAAPVAAVPVAPIAPVAALPAAPVVEAAPAAEPATV